MSDFNDFWKGLESDAKSLINENWSEFKDAAEKDVNLFFTNTKDDWIRWTKSLIAGDLSKADLEWLIKSKKDLLEMEALMHAGIAKAKAQKFQNDIFSLLINTAFKLIK